jgi:1,4-dihydroxy-6-naphthoate synthase
MNLKLGFSPCPNDTFIFDALVHQKIDTGGLEFDIVMEDVETLNEWALEGRLDITKLSFPAYFRSLNKYILLNSGSALGNGVGPLLISAKEQGMKNDEVKDYAIALPGENTTANFLFSFAFPGAKNKIFMRFDKIEDWVLKQNGPGLGVIIHENRFTYRQKGLHKVLDLGEYWAEKMKLPLPLGGIAVKKEIKQPIAEKIDGLIKKSLEYAFSNYPELPDYVRLYSQTLSEEVMKQHIDLYVNQYSLQLGEEGRLAIEQLYKLFIGGKNTGNDRPSSSELFVS